MVGGPPLGFGSALVSSLVGRDDCSVPPPRKLLRRWSQQRRYVRNLLLLQHLWELTTSRTCSTFRRTDAGFFQVDPHLGAHRCRIFSGRPPPLSSKVPHFQRFSACWRANHPHGLENFYLQTLWMYHFYRFPVLSRKHIPGFLFWVTGAFP